MPQVNPLLTAEEGPGLLPGVGPATAPQTAVPAAITTGGDEQMNTSTVSPHEVNAAGTSQNVAAHVAVIVLVAMGGIYLIRHVGFEAMVTVSKR